MDAQKQQLLLEYLISDKNTFIKCNSIVEKQFFDPEYQGAVSFIKSYYDSYKKTPSPEQIEAESGVELEQRVVTPDQLQYTTTEIEKFCQVRAIEIAIMSCVEGDIIGNDPGKLLNIIKEAVNTKLTSDIGLAYFADVEERLKRMLEHNPVIPSGWATFDELVGGGIARKELLLLAAGSGGGKSVTLANLGHNMLVQNLDVLYLSLELSEDIVAQRFDVMYTGITRKVWRDNIPELIERVTSIGEDRGLLTIVQMRSQTTALEIDSYLNDYFLKYGKMPDVLLLDYLDKMAPNEKIDVSNVFAKDKLCSEQLRDLGVVHNMAVATASQLNRSAVGAIEHDHSQISGGISKINEADIYVSIIQDKVMRAKGEMIFNYQKTRNSDGVGESVLMSWDPIQLLITDSNGGKRINGDDIVENYSKSKKKTKKPKSDDDEQLDAESFFNV